MAIVSNTNRGISWSSLVILPSLNTYKHTRTETHQLCHSWAERKFEEYQLDRIAVSVLGEYSQSCEAHGHRHESGYWPVEPQRPDGGFIVLHGQITLHLHLVDTVHRDICEHSTHHQWPPAMPDRRVDLKAVGTFLYINNGERTHSSQHTSTVPRDRNRRQSSRSLSLHRRWPLPLQWPQKQTRTWATTAQIKK